MSLFEKIRSVLETKRPASQSAAKRDVEVQAATAILLLEAAYGDAEYVWREKRAILKGLEQEFGLGRKETLELLGRVKEIRPPVVELEAATALIRDRLDPAERADVVALIWDVVEADGVVEPWEEAFTRHIAKEVGLSEEQARGARERRRG